DALHVEIEAVRVLAAALVLVPVRPPIGIAARLQVDAVALAAEEDFFVVELPRFAEIAFGGELSRLRLLVAEAAAHLLPVARGAPSAVVGVVAVRLTRRASDPAIPSKTTSRRRARRCCLPRRRIRSSRFRPARAASLRLSAAAAPAGARTRPPTRPAPRATAL